MIRDHVQARAITAAFRVAALVAVPLWKRRERRARRPNFGPCRPEQIAAFLKWCERERTRPRV